VKYKILLSMALSTHLFAQVHHSGTAIVPGDYGYYTAEFEEPNIEMIFTEQNKYAAEEALRLR